MGKNYIKFTVLVWSLLWISGCLGKDHLPKVSTGDFAVKVVDALTGAAIPGVSVMVGNMSEIPTDRKGVFVSKMLPPGTYPVALKRPWYADRNYEINHVGQAKTWELELNPLPLTGGLVYQGERKESGNNIYYLNLGSREIIPVIETVAAEENPVFLPPNQILFESDVRQTGEPDIFLMTFGQSASEARLFLPGMANSSHPSVDVTGNRVVFLSKTGSKRVIYLYSVNQGTVEQVGADSEYTADSPVINPEGSLIAYVKNYRLYIYDILAKTEMMINYSGKINNISWHPASNRLQWKLAVEAWDTTGSPHLIYLINSENPDKLDRLTSVTFEDENHRHPCWSSDGSLLFFSADIVYTSRKDVYCIRLADALSGKSDWVMVTPGSGDKEDPNWCGFSAN